MIIHTLKITSTNQKENNQMTNKRFFWGFFFYAKYKLKIDHLKYGYAYKVCNLGFCIPKATA